MKKLFLCAAIAMASAPLAALAECKVKLENGQYVPYQELTFPAFTPAEFDPLVPDGTVLYNARGNASGLSATTECDRDAGTREYKGVGAYDSRYSTYATGVAGIGYRVKGGINPEQWWPQSDYYGGKWPPLVAGGGFTVQLVKTGPITAGGTLSGEIGNTYFPEHGQVVRRLIFSGGLPIRPSVPTCSVQKKTLDVPLGRIGLHSLAQTGASSYQPFSIDLKCSGGTAGTSTRMFITVTDNVTPGNRGSTLTLSSRGGNAASGVGVEIRRENDTLVRFGPDSSATGNPNQWQVGQYGNTNVSIRLKARYVKTGAEMKAGSADAMATFTMSYQ